MHSTMERGICPERSPEKVSFSGEQEGGGKEIASGRKVWQKEGHDPREPST
jgi:hypothetical protein